MGRLLADPQRLANLCPRAAVLPRLRHEAVKRRIAVGAQVLDDEDDSPEAVQRRGRDRALVDAPREAIHVEIHASSSA